MTDAPMFLAPISAEIWRRKYRFDGETRLGTVAGDATLSDTFRRVARAAASVEKGGKRVRARWEQRFYDAMADFGFVPAGRILAGAGTDRDVTLFNCFVMGRIDDDLGGIFENVKEAALTMQQGGGIGHDFSTLRPNGALVRSIGADASGPVSFMDVWDAMCRTIMSAGARRGAMMGTLRCDHPDIEAFVDAKSDPEKLRNFNLSVLVTDAFIAAVREDAPWDLVFEGRVFRTVRARDLWARIMRAAYDYAEPGVIFIDRVNAMNNLAYCEEIRATNPCGEQPLPPYGACLLGSINLAQLVSAPFSDAAKIDAETLEERVRIAVRFLDNVIDLSGYPLPAQAAEARAKRRIGLGVTGLADALIAMGVRYGTPEAEALAETWMGAIERAAYLASADLAAEKGAFPLYDAERFLATPNLKRLPSEVRDAIRRHGIRNGCLTSIAPTGTISLFAGNVSSGVEPVFDFRYTRRVLEKDGSHRMEEVEDLAYARYRKQAGTDAPLSPAFVTTSELSPREHLVMQAALQRHVDSSISKTINCPADISFEDFESIYLDAFDLGLKGCTVYRPNEIRGAVLSAAPAVSAAEDRPPDNGEGGGGDVVTVSQASPSPAERHGDVVYMSRPLDRDPVLAGFTYKIKWPESDHAIYVTINDIERNGPVGGVAPPRRRPFEIFINTRNLEHYAWTVALTRMISAVFRRGGDVTFVADELKAVFDPQGGRWIGGRYVPSLLAAIGDVIEAHMRRIGFLKSGDEEAAVPVAEIATLGGRDEAPEGRSPKGQMLGLAGGRSCPKCAAQAYVKEGGCWTCRACGFSRCS
ncbi:ribonucleotide reductase [Hyphomicrobium nitrativorans NL23]|uniref:Vitamin B12-dependent ribonucleotide reductase n=1 Tax=Hyphomicrobium nitrativorans NL23 TaxID=1029756 RepID=V5SC34_9HYPH|nr:adenosylcobalamin-dependent ribonucleoside-diphosphate reductase [Hyphomicrobium nitrativorans]AHB47590.1 ribonucleotide reductase [Hyphomicrobium nitrativorans NL23]